MAASKAAKPNHDEWEIPVIVTISSLIGRAQLETRSAFDFARQCIQREELKTEAGKKRTAMALGILDESEKIAEHFGLTAQDGFNNALYFFWVSAMGGLSRTIFMSPGDLAKAMGARRKASAKGWARKRHQELLAEEYDVYRGQKPPDQARRLYREWSTGPGAPRANAPASPKAETFERYIRELDPSSAKRGKVKDRA